MTFTKTTQTTHTQLPVLEQLLEDLCTRSPEYTCIRKIIEKFWKSSLTFTMEYAKLQGCGPVVKFNFTPRVREPHSIIFLVDPQGGITMQSKYLSQKDIDEKRIYVISELIQTLEGG